MNTEDNFSTTDVKEFILSLSSSSNVYLVSEIFIRFEEWRKEKQKEKHLSSFNSSCWEKIKPTAPLFKTMDGIDIFPKDVFYTVTDNFEIVFSHAVLGLRVTSEIILRSYSTEDAAKEYILMNKPSLSLDDVMGVIRMCCDGTYSPDFENWNFADKPSLAILELKELAKQKINGTTK